MRWWLRRKGRFLILPLFWLIATGVGPIEEGVEVGLAAGGGEYEGGAGCGARERYRYGGTRVHVNYRPEASPMTLSAEASATASRTIVRWEQKDGEAPGEFEHVAERGPGLLLGGVRVGGQWRYVGFEAGAAVLHDSDDDVTLPLPTARLRVHPAPRHTIEVAALELEALVGPGPLTVKYGYESDTYRAGVGVSPTEALGVWGEFEYRLTDRHSLGLALHYFDGGQFAPMGAAVVQYRWHTTKPRPVSWSDVDNQAPSVEPLP